MEAKLTVPKGFVNSLDEALTLRAYSAGFNTIRITISPV
jgi:hypothetical protein